MFIRLRQTAIFNNSSQRPNARAVDLLRGRHTGSRRHTRCLVQEHSPGAAKAALAPAPRHFPRANPGSLHPHSQTGVANKGCIYCFQVGSPTVGRGEHAARRSQGAAVCAEEPPEGAAPHRGPELRIAGGAAGRRGSQYPGGGRAGRLSRAGSPEDVAVPRAGWGLGLPGRPAAPGAPQPRCLSFGLCGGGGSSTSSAKHCAKQGRAGEAPPDPPQRRTTPTLPSPRRSPSPAGPRSPPVRSKAALPRQAKEAALRRPPGSHLDVSGQCRGRRREPEQQQDQEPAGGRGGRGPGGRHPSPGRSSARLSGSDTKTPELSPPRPRSI